MHKSVKFATTLVVVEQNKVKQRIGILHSYASIQSMCMGGFIFHREQIAWFLFHFKIH